MKNIILIGMPFSGKSSIGKNIAQKIGYKFYDSDVMIETRENMSINDIFLKKGERYFRKSEISIIKELSKKQKFVLASGGGMPIYFDNIHKLNSLGMTIFIDTSLDILINRAMQFSDRPLVKNNCEKNMEKLFRKRYVIYKSASLIVNADDKSIEDISFDILKKINI